MLHRTDEWQYAKKYRPFTHMQVNQDACGREVRSCQCLVQMILTTPATSACRYNPTLRIYLITGVYRFWSGLVNHLSILWVNKLKTINFSGESGYRIMQISRSETSQGSHRSNSLVLWHRPSSLCWLCALSVFNYQIHWTLRKEPCERVKIVFNVEKRLYPLLKLWVFTFDGIRYRMGTTLAPSYIDSETQIELFVIKFLVNDYRVLLDMTNLIFSKGGETRPI